MAFENKYYTMGKDEIPEWLNECSKRGSVKFNYDDGELISIIVNAPVKKFVVHHGETIMLTKSGIVLSKNKPEKVMVKKDERKIVKDDKE